MVFMVLVLLCVAHAVSVFFTNMHYMSNFYVIRAAFLGGLWLLLFLIKGNDTRPSHKGQHAVLSVGMGLAVYLTIFVIMGVLFGFAKNMMVTTIKRTFDNFLIYGSFVLLGEMLRYRLIKDVRINKSTIMTTLVTIVFIFLQINNFSVNAESFFSVIAPVIILNVALSYIAVDGTLPALILLRGMFELIPVMLPVLPAVEIAVWSVVLQIYLSLVLIIYRMLMPKNERARRELKKPFWRRHSGTLLIIAVFVAFNMGYFPLFPSIILTDSMAGALNRGSVAIVKKIDKNTLENLTEGDIIQFKNERNIIVTHRIHEVHFDYLGEPYFTTKGDANERPDFHPVREQQILGVVIGRFNYLGMVRVWFHWWS